MNIQPYVTRVVSALSLVALLSLILAVPPASAGLFGPKGGNVAEKQKNVRKQRDEMLEELYEANPALKDKIKKAAGYATFKQSDVNLFLLASGNGYGVLVDHRTGKETFMRVAPLEVGPGWASRMSVWFLSSMIRT